MGRRSLSFRFAAPQSLKMRDLSGIRKLLHICVPWQGTWSYDTLGQDLGRFGTVSEWIDSLNGDKNRDLSTNQIQWVRRGCFWQRQPLQLIGSDSYSKFVAQFFLCNWMNAVERVWTLLETKKWTWSQMLWCDDTLFNWHVHSDVLILQFNCMHRNC